MTAKISVIVPVYNVEKYLDEMLESVRDQTFANFEVLIINDGSTDGSQEIIGEFCAKDERFHSYWQENQGVSAARNKGLDLAIGEYVVFFDSDDVIPPKALEQMYATAKLERAELVIGSMRQLNLFDTNVYAHTKRLAKTKHINKYDINLIWSFSLANKMFKRSLIEEKKLRFLPLKHAEDGAFVFDYLFSCSKIAGCNTVVYHYRIRPFWEEKSATQLIKVEMLESLIAALEIIEHNVKDAMDAEQRQLLSSPNYKIAELEELQYLQLQFKSNLYKRFISTSLLNGYYRQLWKAEEGLAERIERKNLEYREHLFPSMWQEIKTSQRDLMLEKPLKTKAELCKKPFVTMVVSKQISSDYLEKIIAAMYNQFFPSFALWIDETLEPFVPAEFKAMENLTFLCTSESLGTFKNSALRKVSSKYVCFVDENTFVDKSTLQTMYKYMEDNAAIEFTAVELKQLMETEDVQDIPGNAAAYVKANLKKKNCLFNRFDWAMSNKLFRTNALILRKIEFTDNAVEDMHKLYQQLAFARVGKVYMFTTLDNKAIIDKGRSIIARALYKRENRIAYQNTAKGKKEKKERKALRRKKIVDVCRRLLPVRKKVLFISVRESGQLPENSQALYDAVDAKKVAIAAKQPHATKVQMKIMYQLFTSKVIVTDDYLSYLRKYNLKDKQKVIQIWHACGLFKKFGLDSLPADITAEKETHARYDCVAVSGSNLKQGYSSAFGVDEKCVQPLGTPRTDMFFDETYIAERKKIFFEKYPGLAHKRIVLYAPTFREKKNQRIEYDPQINWKKLSEYLGDGTALLIKNHPIMKYNLLKGKEYGNIKNMNKTSTYDLMFVSDVLITDYSSVIFEYALLNKPIIFYCPDHAEYDRDFYLNFPDDLAGEFVTDPENLAHAIQRNLMNPELTDLAEFRNRYLDACDGHSAYRIAKLIREYLG